MLQEKQPCRIAGRLHTLGCRIAGRLHTPTPYSRKKCKKNIAYDYIFSVTSDFPSRV